MSGFRTKLDFSDNRQAKQRPITRTVLSGGTSFGLPFDLLPTGPNLTASAITNTQTYIASTFSGDNTSTVYSWADPRMQLGITALSALTSSTSGLTQQTGAIWTANTTTVIDGNTVALTYSGVNFDISVVTIAQLTPTTYSGTITTNTFETYSATSLDYTGRTIWVDVSGITRTEKLIISDNPQVGYVWTCLDSEGMGGWVLNSSATTATIWTAGTGANSAVLAGSNGAATGSTSVSEGVNTRAYGTASHAEGGGSVASGDLSHAEGEDTLASNTASHAEGVNTIASGAYSHAEGSNTQATNSRSHAEGYLSIASGVSSHAEGQQTTASGSNSHSEGLSTVASGDTSHAEGYQTTAGGNYSHAEGTSSKAWGDASHAEGNNTIASGYTAHAEGSNTVAGDGASHAEGDSTFAFNTSHAEGYLSIANGFYSHAEGYNTRASGYTAHAEGFNTIAGGDRSHAEGNTTTASGNYSHSEGTSTIASGESSHAEGATTISFGTSSHAEGEQTRANGVYSHAEGYYSNAIGKGSHAQGGFFNGIVILSGGTATGDASHAEGAFTLASGTGSHAEGFSTSATTSYSHSKGYKTLAGGSYSHAEGYNTIASATAAHTEGYYTVVISDYSHAEGFETSAKTNGSLGKYAHAEGYRTVTSGDSAHAEGYYTNSGGEASHSEGMLTVAKGNYSHAEGYLTNSYGSYSHAEGWLTRAFSNGDHAEGKETIASGGTSHAEGTSTIAGGINSHAEGADTKAWGQYSHSEGYLTQAKGDGAHAEGNGSIASGQTSHAEGAGCIAIGDSSHAEGYQTVSNGYWSHAEGMKSNSIGFGSHAEGGYYDGVTVISGGTAIGNASHAEGILTISSGLGSHAGGKSTIASGNYTFVHGESSQATNTNTVVFGANITGTSENTVYVPNLIVNSGGTASKIGVNIDTPTELLHMKSTVSARIKIEGDTGNVFETDNVELLMSQDGGGSTANFSLTPDTLNNLLIGVNSATAPDILFATRSDSTVFTTSADTKMTLKNSGDLILKNSASNSKFGINITNPQYILDVNANTMRIYTNDNPLGSDALARQLVVSATSTNISQVGGLVSNKSMTIGVIGESITPTATSVLIGDAKDAFLTSSMYTNNLNIVNVPNGGESNNIRAYAGITVDIATEPDIHIQGTGSTRGYLGVNTGSPTQRLDINGNARFRSIGSSASAGALHYTSDGTLTTNTSDERLKTNIETLTSALEKVKQLRGVKYNWTEEPNGDVRIGLIAQEVNSVVPELTFVNKNTEEQYMGVHYDNVVALLIEAIKELSSGSTISNNSYLETQTILAEDNNIELNYNGTQQTSLGGGLKVSHAKGQDLSADLITDENGDFVTNNDFKPNALTIPLYTPTSSNDVAGSVGNLTRDDNYLYVKTSTGWKRTNLENF